MNLNQVTDLISQVQTTLSEAISACARQVTVDQALRPSGPTNTNLNMNNHKLINLHSGEGSHDAINKGQLDNLSKLKSGILRFIS